MRSFIHRYLDPAGRLGEILFGLIMALGFTGAVRLGHDEADNEALFIGIFGCNLAWAIVDGVMYALGGLFDRARKARLIRETLSATTERAALDKIADEVDGPLAELLSDREREQIHRSILGVLRKAKPEIAHLHRDDLLGGVAVALIIVLATLPVVVPFLVVSDPELAVRISNGIALTLLFLLGVRWGQIVGGGSIRIATGLTLIGVVLVLVTIALGG